MEIPEKDYGVLESLKGDDDFERIVWSYTGVKKASSFREIDGNMKSRLDALNLEVDWSIKPKGHRIDEDREANYSLGVFLGYPECCSRSYADHVEMSHDRALENSPLMGCHEMGQVERLFDSIAHDKTEVDAFISLFNTHMDEFEDPSDYSNETRMGMLNLAETGRLPEHVKLLLWTCIPCKDDCNEFVETTQKMYESLVPFGKEYADSAVNKYSKRASQRWPTDDGCY